MNGDRWLEVHKAIEGRFSGPYYLGFENAFYEGVEWANTHSISPWKDIKAVRFTMEVDRNPKLQYITLNSRIGDCYNEDCEWFSTKDELLDSLR